MKIINNVVVLGVTFMFFLTSPAVDAEDLPSSEKTKSSIVTAKKDPACVRECGYRLKACSSGCEAERQKCYRACGGYIQIDPCKLVCDDQYGNCEGDCLSDNKTCVDSCPEKDGKD